MANVDGGVSAALDEFVPNVCTNSPAQGKHKAYFKGNLKTFFLGQAFCSAHSEVIAGLGYRTDLQSFLKSCSTVDTRVDPNNYTKVMKEAVETVLRDISRKAGKPPREIQSATDAQGCLNVKIT